jgi:S-disulfanyl-L-cysteine oxidoreductase SoxD
MFRSSVPIRMAMTLVVALSAGSIASAQSPAATAATAATAAKYAGIGRPAIAAEVAAWDIDVRPDFKGLPKGRGSVAQGQVIWESKCESCHGVFGESNEVFTPISGGIAPNDLRRGRVAALTEGGARSSFMKLSQLATLWDYVNRAMPWNAPKTLSGNDVYAVVAYMLHLSDIVPQSFTLSDENIRQVQQRLPNRNGMTQAHGMWLPGGRPDVSAVACMSDCRTGSNRIRSSIPDFARNAHGNLADQFRLVGATRGANTTQPAAGNAAEARRIAMDSSRQSLWNMNSAPPK